MLFLRKGQFDLLPNKVLVTPSPVKFAFFYLGLAVDPANLKTCSKGREASVHPHGHSPEGARVNLTFLRDEWCALFLQCAAGVSQLLIRTPQSLQLFFELSALDTWLSGFGC